MIAAEVSSKNLQKSMEVLVYIYGNNDETDIFLREFSGQVINGAAVVKHFAD
jgi:hypothetical protein